MGHTFTNNLIQATFSTKGRVPWIDESIRPDLYAYMGGTLRGMKAPPLSLNGIADHVHVLFRLPPVLSLSDAMRDLKANASKWVHEKCPRHGDFAWQEGYAAFSVSASQLPVVQAYIENQEAHHRKTSFKEELIALLEKHGMEYDVRYIFD